jgi:hypothetical protein
MNLFSQSKPADVISREIDGLKKYLSALLAEKEVLTEDLKGYSTAGYEQFKLLLTKEKVRIALVRMTKPAEDQVAHERLQGQFNECELLERHKDDIERELAVTERKISETSMKLEFSRKRLKAQLDRK